MILLGRSYERLKAVYDFKTLPYLFRLGVNNNCAIVYDIELCVK